MSEIMDAVVLHSDIARLVLGYLKRQSLESTSRLFCKTSPHLKQEFSVYKKGFTPHSFFPDLEDIICEYVNITRTVDRILVSLPKNLRLHLFEHKLCEKVKFLLERALESYLRSEHNESDTVKKSDNNQNSTASTSLHSDKENTSKKQNKQKRKRSPLLYSSDERKSPAPLASKAAKRRRVLEPFCFLSSKQVYKQRLQKSLNTSSTGEEQTPTDDEYDEEETVNEDENEVEDEEGNVQFDVTNLSIMEKPTKESTPRNKSAKGKFMGPSLPELSQAILDNPQFQMKLVDNINQALCNSTSTENQIALSKNPKSDNNTEPVNTSSIANTLSEEQQIINSNEMLDQMVKDILKATEKDPAFDAIIENVVGATIQPTNVSAGVQCNIDGTNTGTLINMASAPLMSGQQQPQQFTLVQQPQQQQQQQQLQQLTIPCLSTLAHHASDTTSVPRTPLIIRTAVAAGSSSLNVAGESQMISSLTANNSFGSLIDPNFSISKLIVLNPNESGQKQPPSSDQSVGNTTADHIINQLAGTEGSTDEQVYFDANTGQLTIPLFLADEGLLANFPFLVNNDAVTQQLQPDNICNLDGSHIEIPFPEPIIVSADQLPPNSIIVTSAQKTIIAEEQLLPGASQPRTECKISKNITGPSSLNMRSNSDRETPSTSGIVNSKAYKSLSTPRKRTSHVRTLSFSPKAEGSHSRVLAGTTPLSTRRAGVPQHESASSETVVNENKELHQSKDISVNKPIIKNVEILPRLGGTSTIGNSTIDANANDSSNSCNVPHMFVNEESSNQTVIKTELSLRENKDVSLTDKDSKAVTNKTDTKGIIVTNEHADTPKRKQVRRSAVRACKRQISKSSDEGDKTKTTRKCGEDEAKQEMPPDDEQSKQDTNETKLNDAKMMEEWLRLRSATTSDLDSRLRQLNAESTATKPKTVRRKRDTPVKRRKLRRKKSEILKRSSRASADVGKLGHEGPNRSSLDASAGSNETKVDKDTQVEVKAIEKTPKTKSGHDKKRSSKERHKEFNIKIPTPQKDKRESSMKTKSERPTNVTPESAHKPTTVNVEANTTVPIPPIKRVVSTKDITAEITEDRMEHERDRRTANIACLLETPFKAPTAMDDIPPTPGISANLLETPAPKADSSAGEMHSTSYLFGSLTKSELETPQLSAITPGLRFTPFGSSRDVTPRSMAPTTDYSSGGSYYKPDESDDLDRNIDKILKDSAQKRIQAEEEEEQKEGEAHMQELNTNANEPEEKESAICVEIPAEKLRVEPIVLKRVKSFGAEGTTDNAEGNTALNINPHYTLVSELPEICAEEESSNSSSTFSSSTSSSSDSSSTSSSSSVNSSTASHHKEKAAESIETNLHKTPEKLSLSLDNLSSISSTEDEDWQKLAVTEEENSQLVSNDGEVRYPVRSWLTPSKVDNQPTNEAHESSALPTTIKVTVPLKFAEKRNRLEDDLQQKRERMMEKLKQDSNQRRDKCATISSPSGISAALSATRKIAEMRDKPKSQPVKVTMKAATSTATALKSTEIVVKAEETRTIEVLTALQLSAKKPGATQISSVASGSKTRGPAIAPLLGAIDDNAVSTLFSSTTTSNYELTEKTERLPIKTLISKVKAKQRKCLQIEALPALKTSRSSSLGRKNIVRNPLGFKGTTKPATIGKLKAVTSPLKLVTTSVSESVHKDKEENNEDIGGSSPKVSPVPRIKIKTPAGSNATTSSKIRVSPRLRAAGKLAEAKVDNEAAPTVSKQQLKKLKTSKIVKTNVVAAKTGKKLLTGRIKTTALHTNVLKSKKPSESPNLEAEKRDLEETKPSEESKIVEACSEQSITNKQESTVISGKEKTQLNKDTNSNNEGQQTSKMQKEIKMSTRTTSDHNIKSGKGQDNTKSKVNLMPKEAAENNELKPTESKKSATAATIEEKSRFAIVEETKNTVESTTKSESEQTQDKTKIVNENNSKENAVIPTTSIEKDNLQDASKLKDNSPTVGNALVNSSECRVAPTSTTSVESAPTEISEDDPLEGCELTTVTDDDPLRFISIHYDGPEVAPTNPLPRRDFSNFKMVVAFDEDEKHIWRISDEFVLFNASPSTQQIRNIPKKRRVRINTCGNDDDNVATVGVVHSTTATLPSTSNQIARSSDNTSHDNSSNAKPAATSTPKGIAASSSSNGHDVSKIQRSKQVTSANVSDNVIATTSAPLQPPPVDTTEVLQMDDIESLLSHLHGTEK